MFPNPYLAVKNVLYPGEAPIKYFVPRSKCAQPGVHGKYLAGN